MKTILLWLCFCLGLLACGRDENVAGGVDGNPNFLQGRLLGAEGEAPLVGAPVVLYAPAPLARYALDGLKADWRALDTAYTDSDGVFIFSLAQDGAYYLEMRVGDSVLYAEEVSYAAQRGLVLEPRTLDIDSASQVLLDDFEEAAAPSSLGHWYVDALRWVSLLEDGSRTAVTPSAVRLFADSARLACGMDGTCMHLRVDSLAEQASEDRNLLYNMLRPYEGECITISRGFSLVVKARGNGSLSLGAWMGTQGDTENWDRRYQAYALDSVWKDYALPVEAGCLHKVLVGLQGPGELWFDEVRLKGLSYWEL